MTLTDQYVTVAVARTPAAQRAEVEADIRAAVADAVEARLAAGEFGDARSPASAAETAVLNDMGDPEALAASYANRPLHLIGPRLYLQWKRLIILLMTIGVPSAAAIAAIVGMADDKSAVDIAGAVVSTVMLTVLIIGFWVTLIFAVLERAKPSELDDMTTPWSVERLATVPQPRVTVSETVGAIIVSVLLIWLLVWQQVSPPGRDGQTAPGINPDLWSFVLPAVLVLAVIELVVIVLRHARGYWSMRDWWAGLVTDGAVLVLLAPPMLGGNFLNPELADIVGWPDEAAPLTLDQIDMLLWVVMLAAIVWELVTVWRKARRA